MQMTLADGRGLEYLTFGPPDGRPVVLFPGTPATAGCAALVAVAAEAAGVRLISVSRPGYGASAPSPPGLVPVARDTLELLDDLGVARVGVHGISGGGPFALALAAVAPDRVQGVVVSAGPGVLSEVGGLTAAEAEAVRMVQGGDVDGAWRSMHAEAVEDFGDAAAMSTEQFQKQLFPSGAPPRSYFEGRPEQFEEFVADMHRAVRRLDGYVRDNLSWCGPWDIDLSTVETPVLLVYGTDDQMVPAANGEWLDAQLPHSQLQICAGVHGDITFGRAADAYAFLTWTDGG